MLLNRNFQRSLVSYTRLGFSKPVRIDRISPSFHISKRLLSQTSLRRDAPDFSNNNNQNQDDRDDRPEFGMKPTLWRMFEAAATTAASIAILGYVLRGSFNYLIKLVYWQNHQPGWILIPSVLQVPDIGQDGQCLSTWWSGTWDCWRGIWKAPVQSRRALGCPWWAGEDGQDYFRAGRRPLLPDYRRERNRKNVHDPGINAQDQRRWSCYLWSSRWPGNFPDTSGQSIGLWIPRRVSGYVLFIHLNPCWRDNLPATLAVCSAFEVLETLLLSWTSSAPLTNWRRWQCPEDVWGCHRWFWLSTAPTWSEMIMTARTYLKCFSNEQNSGLLAAWLRQVSSRY